MTKRIQTWPGGVVPYEIDLPNSDTVMEALAAWQDAAPPVRLTERRGEPDYVVFTAAPWCAAARGYLTGRQEIQLNDDCRVGVVLHEIGHTVGMIHEHTRPDRDSFVRVALSNAHENAQSQFAKRKHFDGGTAVGDVSLPYDLGSIMHYSPMAFSANHHPTLIPHDDALRDFGPTPVGQREKLTKGDLARLNNLYGGI
ncbi:MAG: M12 family metallopeptidase [Nocardioides sp.]